MKLPLKAFVKYDATGRIVPGLLLLRKSRPVGAGWIEIPATLMEAKRTLIKNISVALPQDLEVGDTETVTITVNYLNGSSSSVSEGFTVSTSDSDVISVSGEDVTAEAEGTATVTVSYMGKKSSVTIEVTEP